MNDFTHNPNPTVTPSNGADTSAVILNPIVTPSNGADTSAVILNPIVTPSNGTSDNPIILQMTDRRGDPKLVAIKLVKGNYVAYPVLTDSEQIPFVNRTVVFTILAGGIFAFEAFYFWKMAS
jgi:hypothetical protein